MEETPIKELQYQISKEEYLDFNFALADESFRKQKRKSVIMGVVELVVSILFFLALVTQPQNKNFALYLILDILLFLFGAYSVAFYKWIFPKQLTKSALKQYDKNEYLQNTIVLKLYETMVYEKSGDYENTLGWGEIYGFKETERLLEIMLSEKRCILIPKTALGDQLQEWKAFFQEVADRYELKLFLQTGKE